MNFAIFLPKQKFVRVEIRVTDKEKWRQRLEERDFEIIPVKSTARRIKFRLGKADVTKHRDFLKEFFQESYNERTS